MKTKAGSLCFRNEEQFWAFADYLLGKYHEVRVCYLYTEDSRHFPFAGFYGHCQADLNDAFHQFLVAGEERRIKLEQLTRSGATSPQ